MLSSILRRAKQTLTWYPIIIIINGNDSGVMEFDALQVKPVDSRPEEMSYHGAMSETFA